MIRYALQCAHGHAFDGWFASSQGYDEQARRNLVECPHCGDRRIEKALMTPAVSTSRQRGAVETDTASEPAPAAVAPAPQQLAALPAEKRELIEQMRAIKQRLTEGSKDVGTRFPEEARRIHYGEGKQRGIYGKASLEEAFLELVEDHDAS